MDAASHESQNRRDIICKNEFFVLFLFLATRQLQLPVKT